MGEILRGPFSQMEKGPLSILGVFDGFYFIIKVKAPRFLAFVSPG
jgi:hypothetical protein